jgi:pimeloyl-ACP methyl ester carboxylesterase
VSVLDTSTGANYGGGASELYTLVTRRAHVKGQTRRRGMLLMPGAYTTVSNIWSQSVPIGDTQRMLADWRVPSIFTDNVDQAQWGNDTVTAAGGRMKIQWDYLKAQLGAKTDKMVIYGGSMGGLNSLNFLRANPTLVAAVALVIPALALGNMYDNQTLESVGIASRASIEAAYGGAAGFAAARDAHDPYVHRADYAALGVPIKIWYSTSDPVTPPSFITDFASAAGATTVSMGAIGHGVLSSVAPDIADFLNTYA